MKFDLEVKQNLIFMAVGCAVCSVLTMLGAWLFGQFTLPVLLGCIVGGLLSFGNFFFMTVGIIMALETGVEKEAKRKMRDSRIIRTVIMLGVIALTILFPHYVHWLPVILSTFYPRILIIAKGYWDFWRHRNDPVTEVQPVEAEDENADGFEKFVGHFAKGEIPGAQQKEEQNKK
ncbi:MAG: ATP synthase subunit I [Clostridia bacterium]|nr:ATP synthase subunit I [Clostridia bacterium]